MFTMLLTSLMTWRVVAPELGHAVNQDIICPVQPKPRTYDLTINESTNETGLQALIREFLHCIKEN